jgi:hypothetical protein
LQFRGNLTGSWSERERIALLSIERFAQQGDSNAPV